MTEDDKPDVFEGKPLKKLGANFQMPVEVWRSMFDRSDYAKQYDRKAHTVITPVDPEWLAKRAEFVARWEALQDEGLEAGFLEHDACYECGGEVVPTEQTETRSWEYDETEEEHKLRIANLGPYDPAKGNSQGDRVIDHIFKQAAALQRIQRTAEHIDTEHEDHVTFHANLIRPPIVPPIVTETTDES